jgi:hypothetical protein
MKVGTAPADHPKYYSKDLDIFQDLPALERAWWTFGNSNDKNAFSF